MSPLLGVTVVSACLLMIKVNSRLYGDLERQAEALARQLKENLQERDSRADIQAWQAYWASALRLTLGMSAVTISFGAVLALFIARLYS